MPLFSVIIPLYNKENFIKTTLKSILSQSFTDYEIIIVNDGSTDNSAAIAAQVIKNKPNAILLNQENQGLSTTRNNGIKKAKGEIIALLDADDLWHKNFLQEIHNLYIKFPEASIYGTDYLEKYTDKNILEPKKNIASHLKGTSFIIDDFFKANWFQPIICQSSIAFKKQIFNTVDYNSEITFAEDLDFYIKTNLEYKFAYYYKPLATILFSVPNQMTNVGFKGKQIPDFDFYEKYIAKHNSLKKYLDFNRYYLLVKAKVTGDKENFIKLKKRLNVSNLNWKQKLLYYAPVSVIKGFRFIKLLLLRFNIRITSN
ncbi:MAG: glycosyltransferase family 2 protein [Oceanihabitans sp.]